MPWHVLSPGKTSFDSLTRANGIINKVPKSHRYHLTEKGQLLTAALFAAREATVEKLIGGTAA